MKVHWIIARHSCYLIWLNNTQFSTLTTFHSSCSDGCAVTHTQPSLTFLHCSKQAQSPVTPGSAEDIEVWHRKSERWTYLQQFNLKLQTNAIEIVLIHLLLLSSGSNNWNLLTSRENPDKQSGSNDSPVKTKPDFYTPSFQTVIFIQIQSVHCWSSRGRHPLCSNEVTPWSSWIPNPVS